MTESTINAPDWLNAELFNKVLQKSENDSKLLVKSIKFTPAAIKGDHYASVMFRASVEFSNSTGLEQRKSLIVKTMPENDGHKTELFKESFIFETEIGMYTEVLPKFEQMLRAVGDETKLGATCLYHSLTPHKCIIFEDLVVLGYDMIRQRPPEWEEVKLVFTKLAKIHALSYKLSLAQPKFFDKYRHTSMTNEDLIKNDFVLDGISNFVELLDSHTELRKYKRFFAPLQANLVAKAVEGFKEYRVDRQLNVPYVLCHGDFHGKNMMFKRNAVTNKVEEAMLLDYQACYMGSIAQDLIHSFYLFIGDELHAHHLDDLIEFYYEQFNATLQKIGCGDGPTLADLKKELLRQKYEEIFVFTTFAPMWYAFSQGADLEKILVSAEYRKTLFQHPAYVAEVARLLPEFMKRGYFDG